MGRLLVSGAAALLGLTVLTTPPAAARAVPLDGTFPSRIALPDGFQPEGIAIGPGPTAWFGSRADGDIYEVSLRTGRGTVISEGPGTPSVGLKSDRRGLLYVAGGTSGTARVVDTDTGAVVADLALTAGPAFVNDVVLTRDAAWFTDSSQPQLYRLGRSARGPAATATTLPLTGEWVQGTGFGANGISTTPSGRHLLVVNSTSGLLYRVDPGTGVATEVDLGGASLTMGDGMLRHGQTLYVVRNRINEVAVLRLSRSGLSGRLVRTITAADLDDDTSFDVPTTVARYRGDLYLPNARFNTTPTPTTPYWVTKVSARAGS
ncbi:superoxide dismutase [Nocardioides sp. zg-1228]|uniref:superoxide dismutase n=1 Tax=Nocardioides sp. zg-1228 TaxID=2763008 RepID=UPI00164284BA|nr:superoxide dismutase [Nocardioides sp. zg-1228]MBC2934991.1 superoxide dismutase [Nocardioides sp. zg-1228]QSF56166.1 superoxide dismutase [Nocardioides sp. zg-1228]